MYLTAVMDRFSRYVVALRLAITLETAFCLEALEEAFGMTRPGIYSSDQGSQYTSVEYTQHLDGGRKSIELEI